MRLRLASAWGAAAIALAVPRVHAQNPVRLPAADRVLTGNPAPVFAIGREEGEDWEILANVTQVAFDRADNVYVLDAGSSRILVFDRDGRYLHRIGQKGGGPGEYQNPVGIAILPDGNLAVQDNLNYHMFRTDGTYIRTVTPAPTGEAGGSGQRVRIGGIGASGAVGNAMLVRGMAPLPGLNRAATGLPTAPQNAATVKLPIHLDRIGEHVTRTTIYEIEQTAPEVTSRQAGPGGRGGIVMTRRRQRMFEPAVNIAALPTAAVISHESNYRIHVVHADGSNARIIERPFAPRRVTRRDQDRAREYQREQLRNMSMPSVSMSTPGGGTFSTGGNRLSDDQIEQQLREMEFAEEIAIIRRMLGDPQNRIWIERTGPDPFEPGPIDLIDAAGRYIGTIRDLTMPVAVSASGLAAWIVKDEMDVQRVEVRQLPAWR